MAKINYIVIFLALLAQVSCKKKAPEDPPDVGYEYAPTTLGKYVVYDVDSTVFDDFKMDTTYFKYRIKEKLEEEFSSFISFLIRVVLFLLNSLKLFQLVY